MTKIEWTERTWNPIVGCSIVSPGCTHCYAMRMAARLEHMASLECEKIGRPAGKPIVGAHYVGTTRKVNGKPVWTGKVALAPEHILLEPLRRKKPTMWFVNSMGDLFHEDVPDAWIDQVFAVMAMCPQHTFQVLTKRSERMRAYFARATVEGYEPVPDAFDHAPTEFALLYHMIEIARKIGGKFSMPIVPLRNVWLGVSAEDQRRADERIPDLLATPAAVRFVSAEPLLGPIDFKRLSVAHLNGDRITHFDAMWGGMRSKIDPARLDWVIVGGESGPGARPMHPDWARAIRDQCQAAGVPFFFKQWGEWWPDETAPGDDSTRVHRVGWPPLARLGKGRAGRLLDGRAWDEMPAARAAA